MTFAAFGKNHSPCGKAVSFPLKCGKACFDSFAASAARGPSQTDMEEFVETGRHFWKCQEISALTCCFAKLRKNKAKLKLRGQTPDTRTTFQDQNMQSTSFFGHSGWSKGKNQLCGSVMPGK